MTKKHGPHMGKVLHTKCGYNVIECMKCGFKHIVPLPDQRTVEKLYRENETYFGDESKKNILDIGSGPGYFLKTGKNRGWEVKGIEPGKSAYEFSSGQLKLNIINAMFSKKNYKKFGTFNVVNMNNVLEHIPNPQEVISMVYEILISKGLLSVTVPNDYNPLQQITSELFKKKPWWVVPKQHINYFNSDTLQNLLERCGFEVVYKTASFPLELFLLMGDDYIGNEKIGREIHRKRKKMEENLDKAGKNELKRVIYQCFLEKDLGREITIVGRNISK